DQDLVPARRALAHVGQGAAEAQCGLRVHRLDVGGAADAIGAQQPARPSHQVPPCPFGAATVTRTFSGRREVTTSGAGRSTCTGSSCVPGPSPAASTKTAP